MEMAVYLKRDELKRIWQLRKGDTRRFYEKLRIKVLRELKCFSLEDLYEILSRFLSKQRRCNTIHLQALFHGGGHIENASGGKIF